MHFGFFLGARGIQVLGVYLSVSAEILCMPTFSLKNVD